MNISSVFTGVMVTLLLLVTSFTAAEEVDGQASLSAEEKVEYTAIEYLKLMQQAYQQKNYEFLYLSSLDSHIEPMQLIHGISDHQQLTYFRYLNGTIRESLHYDGHISYFEQGSPAYTLKSPRNHSVFTNIVNFDYEQGKNNYEYVILGKGRIAGKQSIAIKMISKNEYRYHYIIWCDLESGLPLRLDTLSHSNAILEQIMVISLNVSDVINPWLEKLTQQTLPEVVHIPEISTNNHAKWMPNWLPTGFVVVKDDQHKLSMNDNESVSYILLDDGMVNVSIYVSSKVLPLDEKQKLIRRGATVMYTIQRGMIEINIVGNIPASTAEKLADSLSLVKHDN